MKNKGLTYLELLFVAGLLGILICVAGIGTGAFEKTVDSRALDHDVRLICKTMLEFRNQTVLDGRKRQIIVSKNCMYLQTVYPDRLETIKISYHDNLTLITNTYSGKKLVFYPEGTVSSGGSMTFQNKTGTKKTIVVQVGSGRIYWKEG